jgi:uncharacterized protein (TIGR00251 family)
MSGGSCRHAAARLAATLLLSIIGACTRQQNLLFVACDSRFIYLPKAVHDLLFRRVIQYSEKDRGLTFAVRIVPRASRSEIAGEYNGALRIRIAAPPVEGAANQELIRLLAKSFKLPQNAVEIISGVASKCKIVHIAGAHSARLEQMILLK